MNNDARRKKKAAYFAMCGNCVSECADKWQRESEKGEKEREREREREREAAPAELR